LFTSTDRFRNCIRLAFAQNWNRAIEDAVARVGGIARDLEAR
jgi:DNA-binding transcriptional MocR family regulator